MARRIPYIHARRSLKPIRPTLAVAAVLVVGQNAFAAPQAKVENCGWLIQENESLEPLPDASLKPSDPTPLPTPPAAARAAYCDRDTLMTYVGDERLLKLGLPLVVRSDGREGVLELAPTVLFEYHREGKHYLPGKEED
jgi:hypothetical protein